MRERERERERQGPLEAFLFIYLLLICNTFFRASNFYPRMELIRTTYSWLNLQQAALPVERWVVLTPQTRKREISVLESYRYHQFRAHSTKS